MNRKQIIAMFMIMVMAVTLIPINVSAASKLSSKTFDKTVAGATDITASSTEKADFYIYKSKAEKLLDKPIYTKKNTKSISKQLNYNNSKHYYVKIKVRNNKKATLKCSIIPHLDKKNSNKGGAWVVYDDSPVASNNKIVMKKIYFTKSHVSEAIAMVEDDTVLDNKTKMYNLTVFLSTQVVGGNVTNNKVAKTLVQGLFTGIDFVQVFKGVDFKELTLKKVKTASGCSKNKNGKLTYKNGVVLTIYYLDGWETIAVDSWKGETMTGYSGERGSWSAY